MVGTLVNSMARLEHGTVHTLTDEQIIEMASAKPPEGACTLFPWLLDQPTELLDLIPSVQTYSSALQIIRDGSDIFRMGAPQRHVMAVRSDEGCFAVLWDLSVPRLHYLGEVEAAAAITAPVLAAPTSAAPTYASAPTAHQSEVLARMQSAMRAASSTQPS
jgi:hypothetical protein